jgi:alkanesulfonate monooxygenase SsuD/methylene tetrahydromethanopterin reductase-like flavin-dependent oxidoreductase (luciferase family)
MDLRIGIWTPNTTRWDDLVQHWDRIEECGFDGSGMADHFMPTGGDEDGSYVEGWTALTALAVTHPRLRVAVLVSGNTYRNPALLAKMAATLDQATGGRVDLGIGAGWFEREHHAYGFDFPPAGTRVAMLREAIEVMRSLMRGERTTFHGRYYQLEDAPFAPLPVQSGGIPIMIGAQGERMLRLVAELGDAWNLNDSPARMAELGRVLDRHCAAIGRDPREIRRAAFAWPAILDRDPFDSLDSFRAVVAQYVAAGASEIELRMPRPEQFDVMRHAGALLPELKAKFAARH